MIQTQMDYFINHGKNTPKEALIKKILNWGSEFFTNPIKKCYPGISDFLVSLRALNKNWVTPKEKNDINPYFITQE